MKTTLAQPRTAGTPSAAWTGAVPFFSCAPSNEQQWPRLRERLEEIIDRGKYSQGIMVERLERALSDYTAAKYAIGVGNGTDALILLLRSIGVGDGDEVIVPCFTFIASATSVVHAGATPVFVDINPLTYTLDVEQVRAVMTPRTRAIMPVHLFAQMADMAPLSTLAQETNVMIVEDSAEAMGMRYNGVHAGLLGVGGVLSFFPTKTLGAFGDAGMILTNDPFIAEKASMMRHQGDEEQNSETRSEIFLETKVCSTNSKMDEIQAAVLLTRLERLHHDIARRAQLAHCYNQRLAGLYPYVETPVIEERTVTTNPVYYVYVIAAERKSELVAHLTAHGIGTEEYYPWPLHLQPCFEYLGYKAGDFPNAEKACQRTVALPLYPDLTEAAVERVCAVIAAFYEGGAR